MEELREHTAQKKTLLYQVVGLALFCFLIGCKADSGPAGELPETIIRNNMAEQVESWNSGDLEGFMRHYWKSDSLKFIGKSGLKMGWQTTLDNYKNSYPDLDAMGILSFDILEVEVLSSSNAFVIGKWRLDRTEDVLEGHYTLLWKQLDGNWVIVADHSS